MSAPEPSRWDAWVATAPREWTLAGTMLSPESKLSRQEREMTAAVAQ